MNDHALDQAIALVDRMGRALVAMSAPDVEHRALRSRFSRRGVCTVYPEGEHGATCQEWRALIVEADRFLTEHKARRIVQADLFDEVDE